MQETKKLPKSKNLFIQGYAVNEKSGIAILCFNGIPNGVESIGEFCQIKIVNLGTCCFFFGAVQYNLPQCIENRNTDLAV